ncbi:hypothetical protein [Nocardioides sp. cx-173]|uniref:hypothetical protein n=1 Tax=Nocardioides sp. cx-173 TaxID=2898796 RepID=UPI001E40D9BB|nr:hypothetical protein [Nocardioides sp. cx-173]MCD4524808.1 hypothetical protein [Nocardioides sp. cx-173]UGB43314.1 hypothetical protein LQ940_07240 [Nocardioides sp. cx-173]
MSQHPPPPYGGTPPGGWGPPGPPSSWGPPQPRPPGGLPVWGQVLAGAGIGLFAGVLLLVVVLAVVATQAGSAEISGQTLFWLVVLVPILCPVPMLLFRPTRMWGVGLIIGIAVSTISLAGVCAAIITGLDGSA